MRRIQTVAAEKRTEEQIQTFRGRRNTFTQINDVTWRNMCLKKVKKQTKMLEIANSELCGWSGCKGKSHKGSEINIQIEPIPIQTVKPTNDPHIKDGFMYLTMWKENSNATLPESLASWRMC